MKQSKGKISRDTTAFLYERLSRDDNLDGDSYSIQNHDVIYKGGFLPRKLHHDCGSFVTI